MLASVRAALGVGASSARERAVEAWLGQTPGAPPAIGRLSPDEAVAAFVARAEASGSELHRVDTPADAPALIAQIVRQANLPARIVAGRDPVLATCLDGLAAQAFEVTFGRASGDDRASVTIAQAALGETGTLILASGADAPTTLNFLPELAICVVPRSRILASYEDAIALLRARYGNDLPRAVNLITGPSRTADIEEILQIGAHGPKALRIILVERL
jgi:L-lactate dehydrogenase complex protein LldG